VTTMSNKLVHKTSREIQELGRIQREFQSFDSQILSKEDQRKALRMQLKRLKDRRINNKETVLLVTSGTKKGPKTNLSIAKQTILRRSECLE